MEAACSWEPCGRELEAALTTGETMARSHEALWLTAASTAALISVTLLGAVLLGASDGSWTSGVAAACYVTALAAVWSFVAAARNARFPFAAKEVTSGRDLLVPAKAESQPPNRRRATSPPVRLIATPYVDGGRLRILVTNRASFGDFSARVTGIVNDHGDNTGTRQQWPVPWADDGTVGAVGLAQADQRWLDLAQPDLAAIAESLRTGQWHVPHWRFSSLPQPVPLSYSPAASISELAGRRFIVTVQLMRTDPPGYMDVDFSLGITEQMGVSFLRYLPESSSPSGEVTVHLRTLIMDGEALRAGLPENPSWTHVIPGHLRSRYEEWQQRASTVLAVLPEWLHQFQNPPLPQLLKFGPRNDGADFSERINRQIHILRSLEQELWPKN